MSLLKFSREVGGTPIGADGHYVLMAGIDADNSPVLLRATSGGLTVGNGSSFSIPPYDYTAITYFGVTNNVQTIVYKSGGSGGTTVATLTFTYVASGVADDDDISSIART
jgi:hypothetical protein